jgi:hypothetical protein
MREDREIGRWLALRIELLFPVIPSSLSDLNS